MSENTLAVEFFLDNNNLPTPLLATKIAASTHHIVQMFPDIVTDCVASYNSLLIYYDFTAAPIKVFTESIRKSISRSLQETVQSDEKRIIELPVYYSEETGPDLASLAGKKKLSIDRLIKYHYEKQYSVYSVGFLPGFAYLGFVNSLLASERLASPRQKVAKGSVGIAGRQTGIYPCDSPGGWNIIGKTPIDVFDKTQSVDKRCLFIVGDIVQFRAIGKDEFVKLGGTLEC